MNENSWDFKNTDTQYSTHSIHTWLAAMIPPLAQKIIKFTNPSRILDPFCGGGTVCVESLLNSIPCAGIDVNPLSIIISKAKTTPIEEEEMKINLHYIIDNINTAKSFDLIYPDYKEYRILYWFKNEHLPILNSIAKSIANIKQEKIKTFFQCIFSATIRDVSLTYRNEIRLRRLEFPDLIKFNRNIIKIFEKRAIDSFNRLLSIPKGIDTKIVKGDVKKLPFKNNLFSTIICSPPYGDERNGIPYFQFAKNMLYWMGIQKKELNEAKTKVLGWYDKKSITKKICPDSNTLKQIIKEINLKQNIDEAIAFYSDYEIGLKEMDRVTFDKIVIVIGNRILNKKVINNAIITTELFKNIGLKLDHQYIRNLPSKRIPRFGDSKLVEGGHIDQEHILIYSSKK